MASISVAPPGIHARSIQVSAAATHILLDAPRSWVLDERTRDADLQGLATRADLLGNLLVSPSVRERVAKQAGIPRTG